jgi:hypothetical protein
MRLLMRRKQYLGENETPDRSPGLLQHHLYRADLHQMVLHRPIECTPLTFHVRTVTNFSANRVYQEFAEPGTICDANLDAHLPAVRRR